MSTRTRVIIVDDSPSVCRFLRSVLAAAEDLEVVASTTSGRETAALAKLLRPDVITLDLEMPEIDGLEVLRTLMLETPTPTLVISGVTGRGAARTMIALDLGAVDFVLKYSPGIGLDPDALALEVIAKVRAAARMRVVRSLPLRARESPARAPEPPLEPAHRAGGDVVVVGASTGGPVAVRDLLGSLPADFPAPVLVVQHLPRSFTGVLAAQLDRSVRLAVKEAADGDELAPGRVLVARGGEHLLLTPDGHVNLRPGPAIGGHCPSIDVTMQSAAQAFGARAKGVVLTGMGSDGSLGLLAIHGRGGMTFAQDSSSCVVDGMPQRAIERGIVDRVGSPREIAQMLMKPWQAGREAREEAG